MSCLTSNCHLYLRPCSIKRTLGNSSRTSTFFGHCPSLKKNSHVWLRSGSSRIRTAMGPSPLDTHQNLQKDWEMKEDVERQVSLQLEREAIMTEEWKRKLWTRLGKLKGSQWDPLPGAPVQFSDFYELVKQGQVKYIEYGKNGENVAVILPHAPARESEEEEGQLGIYFSKIDPQQLVWRRHLVLQMPADIQTEIWAQLRPQLVNVQIVNPLSVAAMSAPTFRLMTVWTMRLMVAIYLYRSIDFVMNGLAELPILEKRVRREERLSTTESGGLGLMGQSRARFLESGQGTGVTFDDFAGQEYVKEELKEVVRILKDDRAFEDMGVYCPKGVLLYGPPGTGKTLLARAIAGEAGVPFFSVSGSEFVEMFVGVAAARVRDLFFRAREYAPCIVFIDEIDAIGGKRGLGDAEGGTIEREQGLVQILTELDGFETNAAKVLIIGATNRIDMLDPALLRKGRFDRAISVGLPTPEGRVAILHVHARNKAFRSPEEKETLLREVAAMTHDASGAELQNILNEAAILAVRYGKEFLDKPLLLEAIRRQAGEFRTGVEDSTDVQGEGRLRVAYREAAIAVLRCYFPNPARPFTKTTSRLRADTNMVVEELRHRTFTRKREMVAGIVRAWAPPAVEEMIFGRENVSWMAGTYEGQAASLAEYLVLRTGLTVLGSISYLTEKDLVPHMVPKVSALRMEYMRYGMEKCRAVLEEYRSAVETIAQALLEEEELLAPRIWEIYKSAPLIPQPPVMEVDEYAALIHAGRFGVAGVSLPGRATFNPGNCGFATFGAPRPKQVKRVDERTWMRLDEMAKARIAEMKAVDQTPDREIGDLFPVEIMV